MIIDPPDPLAPGDTRVSENDGELARIDTRIHGVSTDSRTASAACGYQDVERWVRDLHAAGWEAIAYRRGGPVVVERSSTWRRPDGALFRGPYGAWCVLVGGDRSRE